MKKFMKDGMVWGVNITLTPSHGGAASTVYNLLIPQLAALTAHIHRRAASATDKALEGQISVVPTKLISLWRVKPGQH